MSKVILIANQCDRIPQEDGVDYIGVDRGALLCLRAGVKLTCAIGDFDSLSIDERKELENYTTLLSLPCEKNETDGEFAISYAHTLGYQQIDIYGVLGGRQDHFLVILNLLRYGLIDFTIRDAQNTIYALPAGTHTIHKQTKYLSIFPCSPLRISLLGVKYPLTDRNVSEKDVYLVSNEVVDEYCTVVNDGRIIVMECDDK